jgi:hypothetical protein
MDIEAGYDVITVYAGSQPVGSPIATLSGQARPAQIATGSSQVFIRFAADASIQVRPP